MRSCRVKWLLVVAPLWLLTTQVLSAPQYSVQTVGALPGYEFSTLTAINDLNQASGISYRGRIGVERSFSEGFVYSQGTMTGIGFLPGHTASEAYGINNAGQVVGDSFHQVALAGGGYTSLEGLAVKFTAGTLSSLGSFGGANYSFAYGINDNDQAVGGGRVGNSSQALLFQSGNVEVMGNYANSYATAINSSGAAVGYWWDGITQGAFVWENGIATTIGPLAGYQQSRALGINDAGVAVGYSTNADGQRAWKYEGGGVGALSGDLSLRTVAKGVNDDGAVVGYSEFAGMTAFVYDGADLVSLDSLLDSVSAATYSILNAADINNHGWIVADALNLSTGLVEGVVLRPNSLATGNAPEPAALLLVCTALAIWLVISRTTRMAPRPMARIRRPMHEMP